MVDWRQMAWMVLMVSLISITSMKAREGTDVEALLMLRSW